MARSVSYGTTWWGKNWLASLTNIDYANRIPRGRTYANTGKVFDVNILPEKGWIEARVTGMYNPFYKVRLKFEQISPEFKAAFLKDMVKDLGIVSKLTNRELDPALLDLALKHQIKLFPSSWRDLGMTCNCPDMAVPCKHIAAVIYIVSKVIDSNPFYIFSLKGIDLIKEVESLGFKLDGVTQAEASSFSDLMNRSKVSLEQMCALAQDFEMPLELVTIERTVPLDWVPDFTPNSCYDIANIVDVYQAADNYRQSQGLIQSPSSGAMASKKAEHGAAALLESDAEPESHTEQAVLQTHSEALLSEGAVLVKASDELDEALDSAAEVTEATKSEPAVPAKTQVAAQANNTGKSQDKSKTQGKSTGVSKLCEAIHRIEVADFELKNRKKKPGRKSKAFLEELAQQAAWQEKFGSVNVGQALTAIAQHRGISVFGENEEFKVVQQLQLSDGTKSEQATKADVAPVTATQTAEPPASKLAVDPQDSNVLEAQPKADPTIAVPSGSTKVTDLLAAADSNTVSVATSNKRIVIRCRR